MVASNVSGSGSNNNSNNNNGNGVKTMAMWVAIVISAIGMSSTITFALTRAALDNTAERLTKIEMSVDRLSESVEGKINKFSTELSSRVEKAGEEHKHYDIRLDRLETKVGLK